MEGTLYFVAIALFLLQNNFSFELAHGSFWGYGANWAVGYCFISCGFDGYGRGFLGKTWRYSFYRGWPRACSLRMVFLGGCFVHNSSIFVCFVGTLANHES